MSRLQCSMVLYTFTYLWNVWNSLTVTTRRGARRIERLVESLVLVERHIAQVAAERDTVAPSGETISMADAPEGSDAQAAAKIATLTRLKGIGKNILGQLWMELHQPLPDGDAADRSGAWTGRIRGLAGCNDVPAAAA